MTQDLFAEMIGHEAAVRLFRAWILRGAPHALLLIGPEHVGKTRALAAFLAELLRVRVSSWDDPWASFAAHPDFFLVRRESDEKTGKLRKNITIEQVRAMRSRLALSSFLNSWKIAVVEGAHYLSIEGVNALLKTLEEPTPKTVIALVASTLAGIPETVLSRCQIVRFRLVSDAALGRGLERRGVAHALAEELAAAAAGRPGLAVRWAEDVEARQAQKRAVQEGIAFLCAPLHERFGMIGEAIPERGTAGSQEVAEELLNTLGVWRALIRDALAFSVGAVGLARYQDRTLISWGRARKPTRLAALLRLCEDVAAALKGNVSPRLALERLAIEL